VYTSASHTYIPVNRGQSGNRVRTTRGRILPLLGDSRTCGAPASGRKSGGTLGADDGLFRVARIREFDHAFRAGAVRDLPSGEKSLRLDKRKAILSRVENDLASDDHCWVRVPTGIASNCQLGMLMLALPDPDVIPTLHCKVTEPLPMNVTEPWSGSKTCQ